MPIRLINRDMPVFPKQYYNISVAESLRSKSAVLTVLADSPEGRQLIYSIVEGNTHEDFGVNFTTGKSMFNKRIQLTSKGEKKIYFLKILICIKIHNDNINMAQIQIQKVTNFKRAVLSLFKDG